jgi:Asp-tRNA(Asn)/Glu-tRNA(Gln) amidotransferase A subunit family amidase
MLSKSDQTPLPSSDDAIAFAPVTELSRWIESRKLTSERLTNIYLNRIDRLDGRIRSVITLTRDHALARAQQADAEIASGKYRSPLHGIPYGVKDLLDTKGILTTYGAEPFKNRVPSEDSAVVRRLDAAGGVLIAKLSMGALALNDTWFGTDDESLAARGGLVGFECRSRRGDQAALVAFSIGSETAGSIIGRRCGAA